jgi:hypothetical protein
MKHYVSNTVLDIFSKTGTISKAIQWQPLFLNLVFLYTLQVPQYKEQAI